MAPEDGRLLHILSKWNGKAGSPPFHIHDLHLSWLTWTWVTHLLAIWFSFFLALFISSLLSLFLSHLITSIIILLAFRVFAFIFSISICISLHPCWSLLFLLPSEGVEYLLPFIQDHGWATFLSQAPSWQSSRKEKRGKKQILMLQKNKELPVSGTGAWREQGMGVPGFTCSS